MRVNTVPVRSYWGMSLALGMMLVSCGASEVREEQQPLCFLSRPEAEEGVQRPVSAAEWTRAAVGQVAAGAVVTESCAREPIRWTLPSMCSALLEPSGDATGVPITDESTIVRRVGGDKTFVFVRTHRYANGEVLGVLALVQNRSNGLAVRAIGTLRTREERLRVKMNAADNLLIAEGETCVDASNPATCKRAIRFLPIVDNHYRATGIDTEERSCIGPAFLEPSRNETVVMPNGWERRFSLAASYEEKDGGILIHEQVTVDDADPSNPEVPARRFRQVESDRFIRITDGRLVSDKVPLWDRTLEEYASTTVPVDGGVAAPRSSTRSPR